MVAHLESKRTTFGEPAHRWLSAFRIGMTAVIAMLVSCLALAGCTVFNAPKVASGLSSTKTVGRNTVIATPSRPITFSNPAPSRTLAQAWGRVVINRLTTLMPNGKIFAFSNAATTDGQWLVGEIEPRDMLVNQTVYPQIALYNINTGQIRVIRTLRSPQSRIDDASTDGHWLVWLDAVDPPTFYDWDMYVCDLQTGSVTVLAQAARVNGQAVAGPHSGPIVSSDHVVWSQPTAPITPGDLNSLKNVVVRIEDLSSGTVTTLATSAGGIAFSWPWVAWGQLTSATGGHVALDNLVTQQHQLVDEQPNAFALDGTAAVLERNDNEIAMIADASSALDPETVFATNPARYTSMAYPSISDRLLAWGRASGDPIPTVWDRKQHVTVVLPTLNQPQANFAWTGGSLLLWMDPEPAAQQKTDDAQGLSPIGTLCVVNTAQLPSIPPNP